MTDKTTILKAFNNHFFDFLEDIIRVFPDNQDIALAKTSFETIKKANPTIILKAWKTYVYTPYKEVIDNGDITFFLEKDYSNDLSILANYICIFINFIKFLYFEIYLNLKSDIKDYYR